MDTKTIQINRRSANIVEGKSRAPNRSMFYAMGYQEGDFKKPMVGVANGHSTITPCNSGLQKLADAATPRTGVVETIKAAKDRGTRLGFVTTTSAENVGALAVPATTGTAARAVQGWLASTLLVVYWSLPSAVRKAM